MPRVPITPQGREKLERDLDHLTKVALPRNLKDIEEARAHGDITENAEFQVAKETQALLQAQIKDLRAKLSVCEVIDPSTTSRDRVTFGACVLVEDLNSGEQRYYQILGPYDADPARGSISYSSPLGKALLGKEAGEDIAVQTPGGLQELSVIKIE